MAQARRTENGEIGCLRWPSQRRMYSARNAASSASNA